MEISEKLDVFFSEEHIFNSAVLRLRSLILESGLEETYKWSFPTYTLDNKNVVAIGKFKNHFAIWFFNGGLLKDPYNLLENVQEGKTKAMRHWKFNGEDEIDAEKIKEYIDAAIANQKKGIEITPIKKKQTAELILPELLQKALNNNPEAKKAFDSLSQTKQRDYALYINEAKMEKTKISRLAKILPMISVGKGLNDQYR
ncbi:YdeI/OmpD-associated family protein [Maribacter aurantiacus]|uniref:YdhG-like domain-containing protein n=1 Tax=Maribacter aurantiacus TaxID=1882343 RepID=A0A5R8MAC6_9FLAO|nr:DUF1801 domain-containing protein [Maribacter aurantiacus]TLF45699.1 hypothetical protein FEK29_06145 [Maribacter aurantiacus]